MRSARDRAARSEITLAGGMIWFVPAAVPEVVFIDTQVFVAVGFSFKNRTFNALQEHLASGRLRLVLTDITVREVKARIRKSVTEELANHKKFRKETHVLWNSSRSDVIGVLIAVKPQAVIDELFGAFDRFLAEANAEILQVNGVSASTVFDKYFDGAALLGPE
jgi:predicted nucleic acid-binding protein